MIRGELPAHGLGDAHPLAPMRIFRRLCSGARGMGNNALTESTCWPEPVSAGSASVWGGPVLDKPRGHSLAANDAADMSHQSGHGHHLDVSSVVMAVDDDAHLVTLA